MSWTDDRVEDLKELASAGESAAQIAAALGGFDHCHDGGRNAVLSKARKLGITLKGGSGREPWKHPKGARGKNGKYRRDPRGGVETPLSPAPGSPDVPSANGAGNRVPTAAERRMALEGPPGVPTIVTVKDGQCRWPMGDPTDGNFRVCGADTGSPNAVYCPVHARRNRRAAGKTPEIEEEDIS